MISRTCLAAVLFLVAASPVWAGPKVVASIKPVHSLVAAIMEGAGEPDVLVNGAASPHAYALKPSQAESLANAELVFWIGPGLETFLDKTLKSLAEQATIVELAETPGLLKLDLREGGAFEGHDDDDGDGHGHDDDGAGHRHGHDDHDQFDRHIWLDPANARAITTAIAAALEKADPQNRDLYQRNAARLSERLTALEEELSDLLRPVQGRRFIVFHDGYRYFENRFGMAAAGSITISPDVAPGAARIAGIRAKIADSGVTCLFAEPQFRSRLIATVTEGLPVKTGSLDPLGADLAPGPDLYFELMHAMAASMRGCLGG